jgi:hypothetical protein
MISYPKYPLKGGLIKSERLLSIMQEDGEQKLETGSRRRECGGIFAIGSG